MTSSAARRLLSRCLTGSGFSASSASSDAMVPGMLERLSGAGWKAPGALQGFHLAHDDRERKQSSCSSSTLHMPMFEPKAPLALMGLLASNPSGALGLRQPVQGLGVTSPVSAACMPTLHRSYTSLGARHPLAGGLGLGLRHRAPLGLGLAHPIATPTRTYMSEGQLLGNAFLLATDIMFWSGLIGAVIFRRNLIVMLLATEIVMLACNLNFLFASAYFNDMTGVIMSITITTIAACETAIGLALCVTYFHLRSATDVEALNFLK